jgi:hypothetical protein
VPVRSAGQRWPPRVREVCLACPLVAPQGAAGIRGPVVGREKSHGEPKGGDYLTVTISVALVLGAAVILLCKYAGLRMWHAAVCIVLGFYLASTSLAPDISNITTSLFRLL